MRLSSSYSLKSLLQKLTIASTSILSVETLYRRLVGVPDDVRAQ